MLFMYPGMFGEWPPETALPSRPNHTHIPLFLDQFSIAEITFPGNICTL